MKKIKFSIVTCTWNSALYLRDTVSSVLGQNWDNFELIFVDGGSADGTLDIVDAVDCPKKVIHGVRGVIAVAMNVWTAAATGDVVMHLHSDDYLLHAGVLRRAANLFASHDCEWLFGRILNDRGGLLYPETYKAPPYSYSALQRSNFVPHAATFVRRDLFRRAGSFREDLKFAMDYDMWLRLGRLSQPIQVRDVFSVFRRHSGSTTEQNRLASFDEDYAVRRRHLQGRLISRLDAAIRYRVRRARLLNSVKKAGADCEWCAP